MKSRNTLFPAILLSAIIALYFFLSPPKDFPVGKILEVEKGASLRSISGDLKELDMIRSRVAFETLAILYGGEKHMVPGDYLFENKTTSFELAWRLSRGVYGIDLAKLTIPEGYNRDQIAETAVALLHNFKMEDFMKLSEGKEGYLFPDTYFLFPAADAGEVYKAMSDNFKEKIKPLESDIASSKKTENEIITMASIIERESNGDNDRGIISGILWERIRIGMALQADAAPETYKERGLPKNPICNPGIESIKAALHPVKSNYLYYVHDKDGNIHYAKTFEEHKLNVAKYLK